MDKLIPISVAVIILAVSALIVVKETNKHSTPTVAAQNTPAPQKKSTTPFKPTYQAEPIVQQDLSMNTTKTVAKESSEIDKDQIKEEFEDQYTQDYNDIRSQIDDASYQEYKDYVASNYQDNIALTYRFTQENEQWNTVVDNTLNTIARKSLNMDLTDNQLSRLRSGINQFLNNRVMDVIQNPDNVPQTPAQMQQFGHEAKEEVDILLQSELGIGIEEIIGNMNPELVNQIMSQFEEKSSENN